MILFIELGIFNKRIVTPDGWRFAFREVVLMAGATAATRCTVARRRAVFVLRVRRGGKGSAPFALASMITTVVSARARRFFRILRIARRVAVAAVSRTARDAVAFRIAVFVISGTEARRLALLALAFTGATIVCARTFFVVGYFVAIATAATGRTVARRRLVAVLRMFRRRFIFVNRASASVFTAIVSARASFFFRIVGFVAVATVFAVGFVATGSSVLMASVRFAGKVRAALALMQTAVVAASASFVEFMTIAIVGRFAALGAAPLAANTLATATSAANAVDVVHRNVVVKAVVERRALNPLDEVDNAAAVRVISFIIIKSCVIVKRRYDAIGNRQILGSDNEITEVGHKRRRDAAIEIGNVRIAVKRYALQISVNDTKINRPISQGDVYGSNSAGRRPIPVTQTNYNELTEFSAGRRYRSVRFDRT